MKKMFLATLLLVFSGIGLAETPKIINPPRPTRHFKYLLAVKHASGGGHTHYIYTDRFRVETRPSFSLENATDYYELFQSGDYEGCRDNVPSELTFACPSMGGDAIYVKFIVLSEPAFPEELVSFLIARAPKPSLMDKFAKKREKELKRLNKSSERKHPTFNVREAPSYLHAQKAKVVFTK